MQGLVPGLGLRVTPFPQDTGLAPVWAKSPDIEVVDLDLRSLERFQFVFE